MTHFTIHLKPVYSKTVPTPEGMTLPKDWKLSWHQGETFRLLGRTDIECDPDLCNYAPQSLSSGMNSLSLAKFHRSPQYFATSATNILNPDA
jgi:hypothetical protein